MSDGMKARLQDMTTKVMGMSFDDWLGKDNTLGQSIIRRKYVRGDESFPEWLQRVSGGDEELARLIFEKKILFGGRTMANRGTETRASYFNCYSRGFVEDDYRDIMQAAVDIGMTFKAQGGQGISLSKLRPKGSPIGKDYTSDGIIPFMKIYNEVTAGTSQGGARKGALLLSLDARHAEAETFIHIKSQEGLIEKANLSLEIDDEFMEAVQRYYDTGEVVTLHEKRNYSGHMIEYDVVPIEIFNALVDNCYDWADPAALFTNRLRNYNLMQYDDEYVIETVNPCGEQPLPRSGACCLASINLSELVKEPYTDDAYFDSSELVRAVQIGIRSLDRLIDENYHRHPLKEQQEMSYNYRNIGLGVFGYATALMKLGMTYGSEEALAFTDSIFGLMFRAAVIESNRLAGELGRYPKYKDCVWDSDIMRAHFPQEEIDRMRETGLRNCSLISIAPTGSIATMLGESGGCEPEFAMKYTRRTVGMTDGEDTYYEVYCKPAREYMQVNSKEYMQVNGTDELPPWFVGAQDIPWQNRIMTQAIMQKHVDTGISSTVNLPNEATRQDIAGLYLMAWKMGLKGVTIFRDGCKRFPILSTGGSSGTTSTSSSQANEAGNECEAPSEAKGAREEAKPSDLPRGYIINVSDGLVGKKRKRIDPSFYPVIYGLDDGDDWNDEGNWYKANPSLGYTIQIDRVRDAYREALQNPAEENVFRQLRLDQWVGSSVAWIPEHIYDRGARYIDKDLLRGRDCYAGLDLSSTSDITAFVMVFPPRWEGDDYIVLPHFWLPGETLKLRVRRDHVPYDVWERQGLFHVTEGNVVDYNFVRRTINELAEQYHILEIGVDRWNATQLITDLEGDGFTMVPIGMGFKDMSPGMKELYKLLLEGRVNHGGNPVLRWMAGNIVADIDAAENIKPSKKKSTEKIDGIVALIMALDRAVRHEQAGSVYDQPDRGLITI